MEQASIAIVIVNYNNAPDTILSLNKAFRSSIAANMVFFIVDNCSLQSDKNLFEKLSQDSVFPPGSIAYHDDQLNISAINVINVVYLSTNKGFSHANNVALRLASSSEVSFTHFLLLNSDCFVFPETINELMSYYANSKLKINNAKIGAVGGTLLYNHDPSLIQSAAGGWILPLIFASRHYCYRNRVNYARLPFIRYPDFVTGALLLLTRESILSTGLFDESFFLYQEDKDYCMRLKKAGFKLAHSPTALALHKEGGSMASSAFSLYYSTRNLFYIINKHANSFRHLRVLIYLAFALSNAFLKPKPFFTQKVILRAFQDYCLRLSGRTFLLTN